MHRCAIDWERVHRRLAVTAGVVSGAPDRDPGEERRVLDVRARAAAKPRAQPDDTACLEILAFSLGGEAYGVETRHVRQVLPLADLTAMPCTPPFVAGVTNQRGRILTIIDLGMLFELPPRGLSELSRVIVLAGDDSELGLLADTIDGVCPVPLSTLQRGLPTVAGIRERFLKGVTGQMRAVLDGGRLLADAGLKVNEQVAR
jgi:purine-binding chemotaxis protein CheW